MAQTRTRLIGHFVVDAHRIRPSVVGSLPRPGLGARYEAASGPDRPDPGRNLSVLTCGGARYARRPNPVVALSLGGSP